jgi:hypothetical protein
MLECVICTGRKWQTLASAQEEDLRLAGAARILCGHCGRETYWLYSQNEPAGTTVAARASGAHNGSPVNRDAIPAQPVMRSLQTERRVGTDRRGRLRRIQRRVGLQVPVRVRVMSSASQFEEVTRTVNVCRNGLYIQSERPFDPGLPVYVAMNYSPKDPGVAAEQKATVVRVDPIPGSDAQGIAIHLN